MPGRPLLSPPPIRRGHALFAWALAAVAVTTMAPPPLAAQDPTPPPPPPAQSTPAPDALAALRAEIEALRATYESRIAALERHLAELETGAATPTPVPPAAAPDLAAAPPPDLAAPPVTAAAPQTGTYFNPSMSVVGNFLAVAGHDPGAGPASAELSESEVALQAIVDPYARADFFLSFGEEGVEVEEGYATFTSLPANLLVRVGRMRAQFGKVNTQHLDVLPWADQPLPVVNLLGEEGWIGTGISVGRLIPLGETFSEATLQVFRGDAEGLFEAGSRGDLAYNAHFRLFRDLTEATNLDLGLSYGLGPTAGVEDAETRLQAFNATLRWKPLRTATYRSATFRGELFQSRREQDDGREDALGWFLASDVRFARRWLVGARYEWSERAADSSLHDTGTALTLTFWPSEFSQLRVEPRRRRLAEGDTVDELLLQLQFSIGTHAAHAF